MKYLANDPKRLVTVLLIIAGVTLRLWQYFANASLWMDEAALARNIVERSTAALLQPLDYAQLAPPGFLLVEKALVSALGPSEFTLRLFPLACGLTTLFMFAWLAFRLLEGWAAVYAIGVFAIGSPFVYFTSHVKQYSSDIFAAVLIPSCALWMMQRPGRSRKMVLAAVGATSVWFSQPAVFIVAGTWLSLALHAKLEKSHRSVRSLIPMGMIWSISAVTAILFAMRSVTDLDRTYFNWFWRPGFWPWPPGSIGDVFWPLKQLTFVFGTFMSGPRRTNGGLNYPWSPIFAAVVLIGFFALWKGRRDKGLLVSAPPMLALIASALSLYPVGGRVMAFLLPGLIVALAAGARFLLMVWPPRLSFATPIALALLGGAPIYAAAIGLPPERIEHMRPVMAQLAERLNPTDALYIHHSAGQSFFYYAPRYRIRADRAVIGRCSSNDPRGYLRQVDRFRGTPAVWIVATHLYYPPGAFRWITEYLDAIGRRTDSIVVEASTGAYLHGAHALRYDLSDQALLKATSADSFALPTNAIFDPEGHIACYGVESPLGSLGRSD